MGVSSKSIIHQKKKMSFNIHKINKMKGINDENVYRLYRRRSYSENMLNSKTTGAPSKSALIL